MLFRCFFCSLLLSDFWCWENFIVFISFSITNSIKAYIVCIFPPDLHLFHVLFIIHRVRNKCLVVCLNSLYSLFYISVRHASEARVHLCKFAVLRYFCCRLIRQNVVASASDKYVNTINEKRAKKKQLKNRVRRSEQRGKSIF